MVLLDKKGRNVVDDLNKINFPDTIKSHPVCVCAFMLCVCVCACMLCVCVWVLFVTWAVDGPRLSVCLSCCQLVPGIGQH